MTGVYYAQGTSNAIVAGYGPVLQVNMSCKVNVTDKESTSLQSLLDTLEVNNTVGNYYTSSPKQIVVEAGNQNSSSIYHALYASVNTTEASCTTFATQALLEFPSLITMGVGGQNVEVELSPGQRQLYLGVNLTQQFNTTLRLRVAGLLNQTGALVGNLTVVGPA